MPTPFETENAKVTGFLVQSKKGGAVAKFTVELPFATKGVERIPKFMGQRVGITLTGLQGGMFDEDDEEGEEE